ncbi:hypothetical protein L6452_47020 [Arctium lappa]|nr:hypothetical protein L6452_47020 [Arctium lappa]
MGTGDPVSAPNDTHPHWGGVVGGDAMRDAQADVPSAEWLRAQLAFKNSMVHGILQFTPSIAFCYVLHRCVSRDIRCRESFYGLMRGHDPCAHRKRGNTGRALLKFGFPWHMPCRGFDNDPSAGSPTETLLRLLLPLNDKVQWNSRDVAGGETAHVAAILTLHRTIQSDWVICAPAAFLDVVAVSQAPSPESNPNSPSPVTTIVGHYPTIES